MDVRDVREGMTVRSTDGEKLGKVIACEPTEFVIEKGFFFPKDYMVRYEDVAQIRDGEVLLRSSAAELQEMGSDAGARTEAAGTVDREAIGGDAASQALQEGSSRGTMPPLEPGREGASRSLGAKEQVTVPLHEEELQAEKVMRDAGEVRVRKEVSTERKQISVPITKEEVRVERIPASGEAARPGEATFQEGTVSVPLREEEVEIRKRPVVREQVRISKTSRQEERRAEADVRRETADIEGAEDVVERLDTERGEPSIHDPSRRDPQE